MPNLCQNKCSNCEKNPTAQFQPATHVRRSTGEKKYTSEFSALQEESTPLQCFIRLQVLWSH